MTPVYEGNPKHKAPWQPGRKGSRCPADVTSERARELLRSSIMEGRKRYAVNQGRAFCAHEHNPAKSGWHGFPVGWKEVPTTARRQFLESNTVTPRDIKRHWEVSA